MTPLDFVKMKLPLFSFASTSCIGSIKVWHPQGNRDLRESIEVVEKKFGRIDCEVNLLYAKVGNYDEKVDDLRVLVHWQSCSTVSVNWQFCILVNYIMVH